MTRGLRLHLPVVVLVVLVLVSAAYSVAGPQGEFLQRAATAVSGTVGVLFGAFNYSYRRVPQFRLWWSRQRLGFLNPESEWRLNAEYPVDGTDALAAVVQTVRECLGVEPGILTAREAMWALHGGALRATVHDDGDPVDGTSHVLRLRIGPVVRSFRTMSGAVTDEYAPLLERVEAAVGAPDAYTVRVGYPGDNPYFGLFVNEARPDDVTNFLVELRQQDVGGYDVVRAQPRQVEVAARNVRAVERLSKHYLALLPVGRTS